MSFIVVLTSCLAIIVAIISLLFVCKNPLQYHIKFGIFLLIVFFYSIVIIPFALLRPKDARNIEWVSKRYTWLFRIFQLRIELENGEYLQTNRPHIVICNHQCAIDFITMMSIWPGGNLSPLAKRELLYSTLSFGLSIWLLGITFIDRLNPEKSHKTIDSLAESIVQNKMSVWVYPEGTRNTKLQLLPLKKGAFHLAIKSQVPIVCIVTSSYLNFFCKKENKFLPNGRVKVRVLPPVETKGIQSSEDINELVQQFQVKMQNEFDNLNREIRLEQKYYCNGEKDGNEKKKE